MIFRLQWSLPLALLASCAALPISVVVAQDAHETSFVHETSDLEPDAKIIYGTLDNGLRYAVLKNGTPSGEAALRMRIDTGSLNETEDQLGLAHFLEHMAFNGSVNVPEGEMVRRLERFGLAFGADTNASTGFDQTTYKLNLPSVEAEVLDEAFFLMRETAQNLLLEADAIERERGVIASEKAARDSLAFRSFVDRLAFFTQGSGLVERLPIGTDEAIANMQRDVFVGYYRGYYRPENTFVVFAGDIDTDDAIARIERYFGDWEPQGQALPHREPRPAVVEPGSVGTYYDEGQLTTLTLAAMRPYVDRNDSVSTRRQNLIHWLGNTILNDRYSRKVSAGESAYLGAQAGRYRPYEVIDGNVLSVRIGDEDLQAALADAEQELRRAILFGFSQQELDEQIAKRRRALEVSVERADTRKTYASGFEFSFVDALVASFANERVFTSPQSALDRFDAIASELTLEEVNAVFRDGWQGYENPTLYYASSTPLDEAETVLKAALEQSRQVAVAPPPERGAVEFAYTDFGTPGEIASYTYVEDADAHLVRFANNVRLNFKRTEFETGSIYVMVRVADGFMSMPRDSEGLRRLGLNLLNQSGVAEHTADDLETIFAGRRVGALVRTQLSDDAFVILGNTGVEDLSSQMNLMTARVVAPAFREEVADLYFRKMRTWYPTHDASPGSVAEKFLPRLIRSGDQRFGYDDMADFMSPTLEEVREWMEPQLRDGSIEITVVGDVAMEDVVREVARTFGALPTRTDPSEDFGERAMLRFPQGEDTPYTYYHRGSEEQAIVYVYWPALDASDPQNTFRMRVLRSIFRNRLTEILREEMGSTYSPGAGAYSNHLFDGFGYLLARVTATPGNVEKVRAGIMQVARELSQNGIQNDEFNRAVLPLSEDLSSTLENNRFWMSILSDAQSGAEGLARFQAQQTIYEEITLQEMNELAQDVLIEDQSLTAFILPRLD